MCYHVAECLLWCKVCHTIVHMAHSDVILTLPHNNLSPKQDTPKEQLPLVAGSPHEAAVLGRLFLQHISMLSTA